MSTSGTEPKEALFWDKEGEAIRCRLCPHSCLISDGKRGICRVRENRGGKLYALSYGMVSSVHLDPMEKKPLFHFKPGQPVLSFGGVSCNLRCQHCQNFTIAQAGSRTEAPIRSARGQFPEICRQHDSNGVAWTYNEPTIWHEYVLDASRLCKDEGLFTVSVTNGYIQEEPLRSLKGLIDAMNIDVKGFTETFYRSVCQGQLAPVLRTCETAKEIGMHVELTYLIIPTKNDRQEEIDGFCQWVRDSMGVDTPVHFSRFHPDYKMEDLPSTPRSTMEMALNDGQGQGSGVRLRREHRPRIGARTPTVPSCGSLLVKRTGFEAEIDRGEDRACCAKCGRQTDIIW